MLDDLLSERKELDEQCERIAQQIAEYEGCHREVDALQQLLTEINDMREIADRHIRFLRGEGVTITLRVMPMPWNDDDPKNWDWKELLDTDTVAVVS